ncbi:MAG: MBL fold hydrolase [Syntrophobacteraceae bacterium CG07_land_8_20_14_0_80_61_8]|nr:MAG: MBL fold hydrolase [Syntrophobacteraceae bacterium CG07_land_8_20_14_0_80_61_8]
MRITCLGAAGCVTGSCFLVDNGGKYLVDCGMFQGGRKMEEMNHADWGFNPADIKALFLTHAHIDHSGRIPKLVKDGFRGPIYTTLPTAELCKILLQDSAHIQEMEAGWQTRKNRRRGGDAVAPLYTQADAEACIPLFQVISSNDVIQISDQLRVCFRNAGHILGSAILEIWDRSEGAERKVVFSGDLGRSDQLIVKDPESIFTADALFIESTYGNRLHRSFADSKKELLEAIQYSYKHGQKVLIPAFAVERTQEILYVLREFFHDQLIPKLPVYLDSPLAIAATEIFRRMEEFYDQDARALLAAGQPPFEFPGLIYSRSSEDSIAINESKGPAIVIAGNGMCTAGRIMHHLKHNLWRQGCSLVIVGYQAEGSLGRRIVNGAKQVKLFGETVAVQARVFTIGGFSAHADQAELLEWMGHFQNPLMRVLLVHGETKAAQDFANVILKQFQFPVSIPRLGEVIRPFAHLPEAAAAAAAPDLAALLTAIEARLLAVRERQAAAGVAEADAVLLAVRLQIVEQQLKAIEQRLNGNAVA